MKNQKNQSLTATQVEEIKKKAVVKDKQVKDGKTIKK